MFLISAILFGICGSFFTGVFGHFKIGVDTGNRIYIPKEYLRFYGIPELKGKMLISKFNHSLLYQPIPKDGTEYPGCMTLSLFGGLTHLPISWVRQNNLKLGGTVFLLGTTDGFVVYVRK